MRRSSLLRFQGTFPLLAQLVGLAQTVADFCLDALQTFVSGLFVTCAARAGAFDVSMDDVVSEDADVVEGLLDVWRDVPVRTFVLPVEDTRRFHYEGGG